MPTPPGWNDLLDKGEKILWQGQPDPAWHVAGKQFAGAAFGVVFASFALFWMTMASQGGGSFWMFGLIHFAVGLGLIFGSLFWDTWRRRHSWYTLTDRRAFIATDIPLRGKRIKSYPITATTPLDIQPGNLTTIHFASETRRGKNRSYQVPIGFERVANATPLIRLIRQVQTTPGQTIQD